MSRSILDDNYDHAKKLIGWLVSAVEGANEWRESGAEGSARRSQAWERINLIALELHNHAKDAANLEDVEDPF